MVGLDKTNVSRISKHIRNLMAKLIPIVFIACQTVDAGLFKKIAELFKKDPAYKVYSLTEKGLERSQDKELIEYPGKDFCAMKCQSLQGFINACIQYKD